MEDESGQEMSTGAVLPTRALIVRALVGRFSVGDSKRTQKASVILKIGDIVKHLPFTEIIGGKAIWNKDAVFIESGLDPDQSTLELSITRLSSTFRSKSPNVSPTLINYRAFADVSSGEQAGWFQVGTDDVKLAFMWKELNSEEAYGISLASKQESSPRQYLFPARSVDHSKSPSMGRRVLGLGDVIYSLDEDARLFGVASSRSFLQVTIKSARGLRAVNFGGKSDPFVIAAIHGSRKKTKVLKNTLNPVWPSDESTFRFGDMEDLDEDDEISFTVKDWDPLGRYKDLGQTVLTLREIDTMFQKQGSLDDVWLNLQATMYMPEKLNASDLGALQVSFSYALTPRINVSTAALSPNSQSPMTPTASLPATPLSPSVPNGVASPSTRVVSIEETSTKVEKPKLYVRLIQARNLFVSDFGGVSDPYAVLKIRSEKRKTPTRFKTLTPVYDFETVFGERDYLSENDQLVITFFDQDSAISDIVDDELGSCTIPLWSLLADETVSMASALATPRWYSLEPVDSKQKCCGEVQLAMYYTNPALKKKDIYKGKVWLFELQATVITARNLATMSADPHARIKPYCTVSCGSKDRWRTNVATNGVNPTWSERFRFRHSADREAEREGIQRTDTLRVSVFNSTGGECLGQTVLDVAYIMDRLGYVDPQGKAFTDWFDLDLATSADGKHLQNNDLKDEEDEGTEGDDDTEASTLADSASNASPRRLGLLSTVFKRRGVSAPPAFVRSTSGPRSAPSPDIDKPSSPLSPANPEKAPSSPLVLQTSERLRPRGQLRMTIRMLPIGETRVRSIKKLAVYLDEFTASTEGSDVQQLPGLVYAKCRVGFDFKSTPPVPLFRTPLKSAVARLHGMLLFDEEIDWLLQEAARRKALEEKMRRRTKHLGASQSSQNSSKVIQDAIWVSLHNASDDSLLAEVSTSLMDTVLGVPSLERTDINLNTTAKGINGKLGLQLKLVDVKEEMVPLLGHIFAKPLSYKSLLAPRFDHVMRVVLRYGEKVIASKPIVGDPYPSLIDVFDREIIRFPVYNSFRPLIIEIWQSDSSGEVGESRSARRLARSLLSVFKRSSSDGSAAGREEGRGSRSSRWGKMIASSTLNIFEIIEVESQTLFEEEGLTRRVPEEGFKLRVRDKSGNAIGSLWIQAHYKENIGGLLSPNPNPPLQPQKPFSLANFRHEVNRLIKVVGWLSGFGAHVGSLLNWDSPPRTVSTIVIIFVLCSVDWFSSRWLMVFPFCVLVHMVNRHRQRSNGMLLTEFEETGEGEEAASAEVRVACLSASPDANGARQPWRKVHAQVSLLARPGKQAKVIGTTRVDSRIEDNVVDFVSSKLGYSVRNSAKTRPALQMWKYSESLPPVPSFSFRAENFTVPKETILIVTLFSARNLMAADANGFSDPFAKIFIRDASTGAVAGDVIRSVIRPKTLNPVWNERFVLGEKKAVSSSSILVLNFYDSDVVSTSNDPLGNLEIDLSQLAETFPVESNGETNLSPEGRALKGRRWFPLTPPKGAASRYKNKTDFGEVCLYVEWMEVERRVHKASRNKTQSALIPDSETPAAADDFEEEASVESWVHCGAQVAVDLYDQRDIFIGRARFPLGSIVLNDETRVQPQAELTLPLYPRFDGTKDDARLLDTATKLGDIVLRTMITLPDPKAKERRMAMLEARRADRSNPFQKMRMITKHLERIQGQLAAVNARAERTKNLFNWTHPRRTKIMFNLMTFLFVLFTIIPSRFFILMVVLFFFTEKFRPMGTMGARFKHLLSHIPTDDDIRAVVNGDAAGGKRKLFNPQGLPVEQKVATASTPASVTTSARRTGQSTIDEGFTTLSKKAQLALLQNVCAGDALFSGSLSYCKLSKGSTKAGEFTRRFFVLSSMGLHYWTDHEAMEDSKPIGHYTGLRNVTDIVNVEVPGSARTDCFFVIECMDESILFYASSSRKKRAWISAIREHALLS